MKKMIAAITLFTCCFLCVSPAWANGISVKIDGNAVAFSDAAPYVDSNGRTMVPMRAIAEALDLEVQWVASNRSIHIEMEKGAPDFQSKLNVNYEQLRYGMPHFTNSSDSITQVNQIFYVNSGKMDFQYSNGTQTDTLSGTIDTQPVIKNGRTYLPARYIAEAFGYNVGWNGNTKTVTIDRTF